MLIAILAVLTVLFWGGYVVVYFWEPIYGWLDNRWGPQHRKPKKQRSRRRMYD